MGGQYGDAFACNDYHELVDKSLWQYPWAVGYDMGVPSWLHGYPVSAVNCTHNQATPFGWVTRGGCGVWSGGDNNPMDYELPASMTLANLNAGLGDGETAIPGTA